MRLLVVLFLVLITVSCTSVKQVSLESEMKNKKEIQQEDYIIKTKNKVYSVDDFTEYYQDFLLKNRFNNKQFSLNQKEKLLKDFIFEKFVESEARKEQLDTLPVVRKNFEAKLDRIVIKDLIETRVLNDFLDYSMLDKEFQAEFPNLVKESLLGRFEYEKLKNEEYKKNQEKIRLKLDDFYQKIREKNNVRIDTSVFKQVLKISNVYNDKSDKKKFLTRRLEIPDSVSESKIAYFDDRSFSVRELRLTMEQMRRRFKVEKIDEIYFYIDKVYMFGYLVEEAKENNLHLKKENIQLAKSDLFNVYEAQLEKKYIDENIRRNFSQKEMEEYYQEHNKMKYGGKTLEEVKERVTNALIVKEKRRLKGKYKEYVLAALNPEINYLLLEEFAYNPEDNKR